MMAFSSLTAKLIKIIVIKWYVLKKMVANRQKWSGWKGIIVLKAD